MMKPRSEIEVRSLEPAPDWPADVYNPRTTSVSLLTKERAQRRDALLRARGLRSFGALVRVLLDEEYKRMLAAQLASAE